MAAFAKLYGEGDDQILVVRRQGETGAEVRFFFTVPNILEIEVGEIAGEYPATEQGDKDAYKKFKSVT